MESGLGDQSFDALTRRSLLRRGLVASGALAAGGLLGAGGRNASAAVGLAAEFQNAYYGTSRLEPSLLPSPAQVFADVKHMVDLGQRHPGSDPHNAFIDWIDARFRSAGLQMLPRDDFEFTRWLAKDWSLEILDGPDPGNVAVSAYQPYSGNTRPTGITAPLAYLGPLPPLALPGNLADVTSLKAAIQSLRDELDHWATAMIAAIPGGIAGRIMLIDAQTAPVTEHAFAALSSYVYDPDAPLIHTRNYKRTALSVIPTPRIFADAGAAGMIVVLDSSPANAAGTYGPYGAKITDMPGLLVDRDTGKRLRHAAETLPRARMVLTADVKKKATTPQLVGILPGDGSTDEVMIVNTHTDGMNAFEENGGIGLAWLADYFSKLPKGRRLKRSLIFSAVSGHFAGPALPQTRGFIERHPDLVTRAAASVTIEHLGASEWLDDARGFYSTGRPDMFLIWHSQTPIAGPIQASMVTNDLKHSRAMRPAGDYMIAVGTAFHEVGVPTVSSIVAPNYMVSWADNGHLDKFMPERAAREIQWAADLLQRLDSIPAVQLAAGDSAVLRSGAACALGGNTPGICMT